MPNDADRIVRIDIAEMAVRIAEAITHTGRPESVTPKEALTALSPGEAERYMFAAKIAAGYALECVRAAERLN